MPLMSMPFFSELLTSNIKYIKNTSFFFIDLDQGIESRLLALERDLYRRSLILSGSALPVSYKLSNL